MDMNMEESDVDRYNEEQPAKKKVLIMKDVKMRQIINDPHQKILYVFDFLKMITLNIELMKIVDANTDMQYPRLLEQNSELHLPAQGNMDIFPEELVADEDSFGNIDDDDEDEMTDDSMNGDSEDDMF